MEGNNSQRAIVPIIFVGVAVLVIAAGIFVRSRDSSSPEPLPESPVASAPAPETAPPLAPEPRPLPAPPTEPSPQIKFSPLVATDADGATWTLGLKGLPYEIPEGCTKAGAPLAVMADVAGGGRSISIGLTIQGQAGEVYEPGAARNGRRRPAPTFTVFDESGKALGSGSFEYG